jgi:hypothetical protein
MAAVKHYTISVFIVEYNISINLKNHSWTGSIWLRTGRGGGLV